MRYHYPPRRPPCMQMPGVMMNNNYPQYGGYQGYCPPGTIPYMVLSGDTLYSIAMSTGVSIDQILQANPQIVDPNIIYAGTQLCIPYEQTCDGFQYTIKPGDTLYSIAMSFGITLEELLAANPDLNPNYYQVGQVICIPESYPCPGNQMVYVIKDGDTLTSILTDCKVSLNALLAANPGFDPKNIMPGTKLCIVPTPCEPLCPEDNRCIVPKGCNTLEALAKHIHKSCDDILLANPNYPPCYFIPGHPYCKP